MNEKIYQHILYSKRNKKKLFAVLIDPDKYRSDIIKKANEAKVDILLIGGSLLSNDNFEKCVIDIRKRTKIPVVIFPGNELQISNKANGMLLLSLISGRNPDLLIGKHVIAAPQLRSSKLEIIPTGYMLIDSGKQTSALYMSNTNPIPHNKPDIAACTAMAGEMLGLKMIYMDAGSGAENCVNEKMIREVRKNIQIPLIVGGGINSISKAQTACESGADIIVVGNAAEKNSKLIIEIAEVVHSYKK